MKLPTLTAALVLCTIEFSTRVADTGVSLPIEGRLPSLAGAKVWLASPPLDAPTLRGRVVLVQFWTYSCINWLRTLPYVRAWAERYRDRGLVVIGVHSPEFEFERDVGNVRQAVKEMKIAYPVAIDSDHVVWNAFNNAYWPALYFVDAQGRIRHHRFGEGDYQESERIIQQLLAEAGRDGAAEGLVSVDARGAEAGADWDDLRSGETYLGFERTENFVSPGGVVPVRRHLYSIPANLGANQWALRGEWSLERGSIVLNEAHGRVVYRFCARDVHLVMGRRAPAGPVRFRVLIDARPPGPGHGADTDEGGNGTVTGDRLYQLIRQAKPIVDRQIEIEFLDPGVELYSFTFG
jgi:thiol-disulfide isomerase/thioredoxin